MSEYGEEAAERSLRAEEAARRPDVPVRPKRQWEESEQFRAEACAPPSPDPPERRVQYPHPITPEEYAAWYDDGTRSGW